MLDVSYKYKEPIRQITTLLVRQEKKFLYVWRKFLTYLNESAILGKVVYQT